MLFFYNIICTNYYAPVGELLLVQIAKAPKCNAPVLFYYKNSFPIGTNIALWLLKIIPQPKVSFCLEYFPYAKA